MNKFWVWFFGTFLGTLIGGIVVFFMSPVNAEEFRENWRLQYERGYRSRTQSQH